MIAWREKFVATGVHFAVTLVLALAAAALIFLVWFPHPFEDMMGGTELFVLVVSCDLVLGPLMSLVIYNSRKSRRSLIIDYTLVGIVQMAALVYGVWTVAGARPVYLAFSLDRYEVVAAADLKPKELAAASRPEYRTIPWNGFRIVSIVVPPDMHNDALFESLAGNEEHHRPRFYAPLAAELDNLRRRAKPLEELERKKPEAKAMLARALAKVDRPRAELSWLPVRSLTGFWTVVVGRDGLPVTYLPLDPY